MKVKLNLLQEVVEFFGVMVIVCLIIQDILLSVVVND